MATVSVLSYDPNAPEVIADPYPVYEALRTHDPVHYSEALESWVLSRYHDCVALLRDERFSADRTKSDRFPIENRELPRSMLGSDPPDHTRLRTLVNRAFTPRTVRGLEPRITEIVDRLLDAASERGEMDAIADFAYPLPVTVIAEMLGVPPEDHERFHRWSEAIALALGPMVSEDRSEQAIAGRNELAAYLIEIIERRRREPGDDLITELIRAEEEGDRLSSGELLVMCILLLVAGHETTVNLVGNGLWALLHHPEELARFRDQPGLAKTGTEELLRYDSPVQFTSRVATVACEIHGREIHPGQVVFALLASANRDTSRFEHPDILDLAREDNPHLSFSAGIHYCLGAQLARVEGRIALTSLLRRFPHLHAVTEDVRWRPAPVLRGLEALPVELGGDT